MTDDMRVSGSGAIVLLAAAIVAFGTAEAWAQGATAPLDKVTISGDAAKRALTKVEINADTAERIVTACVALAKEKNSAVSVFVLSPSGDIVHAHRMDGQTPINIETAYRKAKTALWMRTSTRDTLNRFNNLEAQLIRVGLDLYLVPGGLPIIVNDQLIGAIGVGGGNMDEQCAHEALTKVLGPQPSLAPTTPFGGVGPQPPPTQPRPPQ